MFLKSELLRLSCLGSGYSEKSTLFLSGGGSEDITHHIDEYFLKNILPPKDKIKVLFIPLAKSGDMNVYKKSLKWLQDKFLKIDKESRLDFVLCTKLANIKNLNEYDALYIGGGNTYRLVDLFNKNNFNKKLVQYLKLGGIVYGASAGAVIFGKKISTFIEDKYLSENIKHGYTEELGLSVLGNYSFLTHFDNGDEDKLSKFFSKNKSDVICIPPGTAMILGKSSFNAIGPKSVVLYRSNGSVEEFRPN